MTALAISVGNPERPHPRLPPWRGLTGGIPRSLLGVHLHDPQDP